VNAALLAAPFYTCAMTEPIAEWRRDGQPVAAYGRAKLMGGTLSRIYNWSPSRACAPALNASSPTPTSAQAFVHPGPQGRSSKFKPLRKAATDTALL
jgi:hypothetical protein